eukprot:3660454-Lingulodinium_polyedra.AAC.1
MFSSSATLAADARRAPRWGNLKDTKPRARAGDIMVSVYSSWTSPIQWARMPSTIKGCARRVAGV